MEQCTVLDELDKRQDEVLQQLSELNSRVESLLRELLAARETDAPEEPEPESKPVRKRV